MLRDELKPITGKRRIFFLLRIADIDTDTARKLTGTKKGTYNSWLQDSKFVELYRRRDEFSTNYKQEAIQLLRRDNQLAAVLLESKIITKMKEEIEVGEYDLVRTNLGREVYSKLINDLDYQPPIKSLTWEQRIQQLVVEKDNPQIGGGEAVEGEFEVKEVEGGQS